MDSSQFLAVHIYQHMTWNLNALLQRQQGREVLTVLYRVFPILANYYSNKVHYIAHPYSVYSYQLLHDDLDLHLLLQIK